MKRWMNFTEITQTLQNYEDNLKRVLLEAKLHSSRFFKTVIASRTSLGEGELLLRG
jgi:hypothetical protein